jgi:transposase-like protein
MHPTCNQCGSNNTHLVNGWFDFECKDCGVVFTVNDEEELKEDYGQDR